MSEKYQPKKGDRVRVVIEGEVAYDGSVDISVRATNARSHVVWTDHVVSVEKVAPPLPTTPGSVIEYGHPDGGVRMLLEDGDWISPAGVRVDADSVRFTADRYGFEVLGPTGSAS